MVRRTVPILLLLFAVLVPQSAVGQQPLHQQLAGEKIATANCHFSCAISAGPQLESRTGVTKVRCKCAATPAIELTTNPEIRAERRKRMTKTRVSARVLNQHK